MTVIENNSPKVQYTGPYDIGQLLPLTFPYDQPEDVHMQIGDTEATYNTEYFISGLTPESVTLKEPIDSGVLITIYRETPLDQQSDFPQNARFSSKRIEDALDKICMEQQEQEEKIARCVIAPISMAAGFSGTLPPAQSGKALIWNTDENGFVNSSVDLSIEGGESIKTCAEHINEISFVADNITNINAVNNNKNNINICANNMSSIVSAPTYANNAQIWAEGTDAQVQALGGVHSSKGWAEYWTSREFTINVKDFGAKGDGTTDDRASIQSAIDYCINQGGGTVYFPKGMYLINSYHPTYYTNSSKKYGLVIHASDVCLLGEAPNATIALGSNLSTGELDCILRIQTESPVDVQATDNHTKRIHIKNFFIEGDKFGYRAKNGIDTCDHYMKFSKIENVFVKWVTQIGIKIDCYLTDITEVSCQWCDTGIKVTGIEWGTILSNSAAVVLTRCWMGGCKTYGYHLPYTTYVSFVSCSGDNPTNPNADGAKYTEYDNYENAIAFYIESASGIAMIGCACEGYVQPLKVDYAVGLAINGFFAHGVGSFNGTNPITNYLFEFGNVHKTTISGVRFDLNNPVNNSLPYIYGKAALGVTDNTALLHILDESFDETTTYRKYPSSVIFPEVSYKEIYNKFANAEASGVPNSVLSITNDLKVPTVSSMTITSPTITNGIASNFSATKILSVPYYSISGAWKITFKLKFSTFNSQPYMPLFQANGKNKILLTPDNVSGGYITIYANEDNSANTSINLLASYKIKFDVNYIIELSYNGTSTYSGKAINLSTGEVLTDSATLAHYFPTSSFNWFIGSDTGRYFTGGFDLTLFTITQNGKTDRPYLQLFYKSIGNGDKVINVSAGGVSFAREVLMEQVQYLIDTYGFNPFYVMDRTNQAITARPTCKGSDIVYEGSNYKYNAMLECEQMGSCTNGTTVTFTKPFADTNYIVSVPYSAKYVAGFTPSQTGDYIVKGKILLDGLQSQS